MKKITQKILLSLAMAIAAVPAMAQFATPTNFTPVAVSEGKPLRFFANLGVNTQFSAGGSGFAASPTGKFVMDNGQLNLGLVYSVFNGFDVGFGIHGGMFSPYGMFASMPAGVSSGYTQYGMMFGADVMARYLANFSDMFYGGVQAQVGYDYTDLSPGQTDFGKDYNGNTISKGSFNSFIPVTAGIVLGMDFKDAVAFYLFPAIELGQTGNYTNTTMPAPADVNTGVWKSAVGMQIAVGTAIDLGMTKLVLEVKPRMANFSNSNSWGMDATLGAFWDF